ncbi:MAG: hypothetical protein KAK00_00315 [Nanoarchaeota archaeon]|nr:hypothetical protein [Nanoarchaeota archaeon]
MSLWNRVVGNKSECNHLCEEMPDKIIKLKGYYIIKNTVSGKFDTIKISKKVCILCNKQFYEYSKLVDNLRFFLGNNQYYYRGSENCPIKILDETKQEIDLNKFISDNL